MRFTNRSMFTILSEDDAQQATGLDTAHILDLPSVQSLVRTFADGREELAFRVPNELLATDEPA